MNQEAYPDALPAHFRLHWYELERVLGQGGFGITYLAHDSNLDVQVAIKEYLPSDVAQRRSDACVRPRTQSLAERYRWGLGRFVEEARTLARFDHPNIVRVQSVFEANDTAYMVMRFEEGENLATLLERRGTLGADELMRVLLPIIDGLEHVHQAGFIHRDIKPENIHIRSDGSPVLLDFGSARLALGQSKAMTVLVAPGYAPLEQYYGEADTQGPWTDIYGLAATAYRAITGVPPQDAVLRAKGRLGSTTDTMVPAATLGRDRYDAHFLAAIDHGLQLAESDRPQSLAAWRRELLADRPAPFAAAPRPAPVVKAQPARRDATGLAAPPVAPTAAAPAPRPLGPWAGAAILGLALLLGIGVWKMWPRTRPAQGETGAAPPAPAVVASAPSSAPVVAIAAPPPPAPSSASAPQDSAAGSLRAAPPSEDRAHTQRTPEGPAAAAPPAIVARVRAPPATPDRASTPSRAPDLRARAAAAPDAAPRTSADAPTRAPAPEPVAPSAQAVVPQSFASVPAVAQSASAAQATPPVAPALPEPFAQAEDAYRRGDYAGAYRLVRPLGDKGQARAQEMLGRMAEEGRGIAPNALQAYIWYSLAAQRGQATARAAKERTALKLQPAEIAQAERLVQNWQPQ